MFGKGVVSLALLVLFLASHGHVANAQCSDSYSFCGSLYSNCFGYLSGSMIKRICPRTCGACQPPACVDSSSACKVLTRYCSFTNVTVRGKTIKEYCKLSCANCPTTTPTYNGCSSNPCKNNGLCTQINNGFTCMCMPGYSGSDCGTRSSR